MEGQGEHSRRRRSLARLSRWSMWEGEERKHGETGAKAGGTENGSCGQLNSGPSAFWAEPLEPVPVTVHTWQGDMQR